MMRMMLMMQHLFRLGPPDDAHDDAYDAYDGGLGGVSSFCNSGQVPLIDVNFVGSNDCIDLCIS